MKKKVLALTVIFLVLLGAGIYFLFQPVDLTPPEPEEEIELPRREVENFQLFLPPQEDGLGLELRGDLLVESPDGTYMDLTGVWGEFKGLETEGFYEVEADLGYLEMDPEYLRLEENVVLRNPLYTMEMGFLEWYGGDPTLYGGGGVFIQGEGFSGQGEKVELRDEMELIYLRGDSRLYLKREGDGVETP